MTIVVRICDVDGRKYSACHYRLAYSWLYVINSQAFQHLWLLLTLRLHFFNGKIGNSRWSQWYCHWFFASIAKCRVSEIIKFAGRATFGWTVVSTMLRWSFLWWTWIWVESGRMRRTCDLSKRFVDLIHLLSIGNGLLKSESFLSICLNHLFHQIEHTHCECVLDVWTINLSGSL